MNDLIHRTRPTDEALRAEWAPAAGAVPGLDTKPQLTIRRGVSRRTLLVAGAVVAVGALAIPIGLAGPGTQTATAAPLQAVAAQAARQPRWEEGQFLHVRTTSAQSDERGTRRVIRDNWIAPDGWIWSLRTVTNHGSAPVTEADIFEPSTTWLNPDYAAKMPTDPHQLDKFLRARAVGSPSEDEAVFVAIGDMLKHEAAPPALRAAAIRTLALNPKITVTEGVDPAGRTALRVTFVDEAARPGARQFLYLDPDTGNLLAEGSRHGAISYSGVITLREVVTGLPAHVVQRLGTEKVIKNENGTSKPEPRPSTGSVPSESYTTNPTRR